MKADIHFWWWGLRFHLGKLSGGVFIYDGFELSHWRMSVSSFPAAGACLNGTLDLHIGPLVLVWVR